MSEISKNREEKQLALDKIKNKKLVKILNQKMFKGYRDIKRSKLNVKAEKSMINNKSRSRSRIKKKEETEKKSINEEKEKIPDEKEEDKEKEEEKIS